MNLVFNISGANGDVEINLAPQAVNCLDDSLGVVVFPFYDGKFIMTFHMAKKAWKFPAGQREEEESVLECVLRKAFEETGAILKNVIPLGYYIVKTKEGSKKTAIYMSDVDKFEPKPPWSETGAVKIFYEIPEDISHEDDVYKILINHIKNLKEE